MTGRAVGRYNLQRLGWSAFEDLCVQIMRVTLGETTSRYLPGRDQGRDGWFQGIARGKLNSERGLSGSFLIQCKHTSKAEHALDLDDLRDEVTKVERFARSTPLHYLLMTNRRASATHEKAIRERFERIPNVQSCTVLGETWIEDTIDAETRLLRLVPRLYGIGDLSQILATTVQLQTAAVLEDLTQSLQTFVPTSSYRRAEKALTEHGFVLLVGPPASGKSSIAANLCMVSLAQDAEVRILRIETAEKFKDTWSPADKKTIYWVDDVFGETTLDDQRLREWSAALEKVEAARRRGATILFCTRDYILADAESKLKHSKNEILNDARVRVDVTSLSTEERQHILYNHIKHGDIARERKRDLKPFLREVAAWSSFTPELARRLGSSRFSTFPVKRETLTAFFQYPVQHFREVIHGLSRSEMAALAVCLLGSNHVPDPVPDAFIPEAISNTYSVTKGEVRDALERLDGSFVRRDRSNNTQSIRLHHPSMIDALQEELVAKSSQLDLFLRGARLEALTRNTTMLPPGPNQRLVFLGSHLYPIVLDRIRAQWRDNINTIASFLAGRASDAFLREVEKECPELLDAAVAIELEPEGSNEALDVGARLLALDEQMLSGNRRTAFVSTLQSAFEDHGFAPFLKEDELMRRLPELAELIRTDADDRFPSIGRLLEWHSSDLSSTDLIDYALDAVRDYVRELRSYCEQAGMISSGEDSPVAAALASRLSRAETRLQEEREEREQQEDLRADHDLQTWKDERYEREWEASMSPFADVDE